MSEARRLAGLDVDHLREFGAELLTREYADGHREQAIRLPAQFVPDVR